MIARAVLFLSLIIPTLCFATPSDSLAIKLDNILNEKETLLNNKLRYISLLKDLLKYDNLSEEQLYDTNKKLYQEYSKFITDSAIHYALENKRIAESCNNINFRYETKLQLAWLYSTKGLYIEANKLLNDINKNELPASLLPQYYWTYCAFYSHYAASNNEGVYNTESSNYRALLLSVLDTNRLDYKIEYATKLLYENKLDEAKTRFKNLLNNITENNPNRALVAYLLGYAYKQEDDIEMQKRYFSISAISDATSCIKNNASFQELALAYYESGDIDKAFKFMQVAIENAIFCNAQFRTMQGSEFYSIINSSFQEKEKAQKNKLKTYLTLISILTIILIFIIALVYVQVKRLSRIRKELKHSNEELKRLNNDLQILNNNLAEADHVKEEYIAQFFDQCSKYIAKLEDYRKELNNKAKNNQLEELYKTLKSTTLVDEELKELYLNFDSVFLNIYPTFVEDFNALLLPDEQITPKSTELLNTELRIFALIRLGITDSANIANFLRYSLRTVYNYRTKVRNKALGCRDEFEENVKKIGVFAYRQ